APGVERRGHEARRRREMEKPTGEGRTEPRPIFSQALRRPALALGILLLLAGVVVSRPLLTELVDGLPVTARGPVARPVLTRPAGDALQLYYQLWLVRDGLLAPTPLLRDPDP